MRYSLGLGLAMLCCTLLGGRAAALEVPRGPERALEPAPLIPSAPARTLVAPPLAADKLSPATPSPPAAVGAAPATAAAPIPKPVAATVTISQDPRPTLDPASFINTMRAAGIYLRIAQDGGWPELPPGTILKVGDKGPLVAILRNRLAIEGDLPADRTSSTMFDAELAGAVKRFQSRHGLPESGAVRARTIEALNVPATARHRQLSASARRLMASTFPFGERHVVVNIPSAAVEAVESGRVVRRYVAVVGKPERASPVVETRITAVNLNPTWTVPVSLIRKDIIPHVRKDPGYLAKMKIRILDGKGQEIDPQTLDWTTESAVNYTLRQDPGAINSLGQIRIDMPNKHAVYMHDTPTKRLFAQDARFHSSGCVRVADVGDFSEWLLRGTPATGGAWSRLDLDTAIATGARQDVRLAKAVPVAWVYLTGYALADGTVQFRNDIYGLDTAEPEPAGEPQILDVPATAAIPRKRS